MDRPSSRPARYVLNALLGLLFAVLVTLSLSVLALFQSFSIPSGSMIPTLLVGDVVIVAKYPYGFSRYSFPLGFDLFKGRIFAAAPRRGDVVVFRLPRDPTVSFVKRIIGLPGETVQMKEGRLFINDAMVPRETIAKIRTEDFYGRMSEVPTYRETLPGGVRDVVIEIQGDTGFNDNTEAFKVPDGQYFVLGDNRDNAMDSRVSRFDQGGVGTVPFENFVGRVEYVIYSWRNGGLRFDRSFEAIH